VQQINTGVAALAAAIRESRPAQASPIQAQDNRNKTIMEAK
jgi:hypothetical protein